MRQTNSISPYENRKLLPMKRNESMIAMHAMPPMPIQHTSFFRPKKQPRTAHCSRRVRSELEAYTIARGGYGNGIDDILDLLNKNSIRNEFGFSEFPWKTCHCRPKVYRKQNHRRLVTCVFDSPLLVCLSNPRASRVFTLLPTKRECMPHTI